MTDKLERIDVREEFNGEYLEIRYYSTYHMDGKVTYYAQVIFGSGDSYIVDGDTLEVVEAKLNAVLPLSFYVRRTSQEL